MGRSLSALNVCSARETESRSLASATVVTFQPYAMKRAGDVLRERDVGVPLDGDPVRVVDPAQVRQREVPGQRCRLRGDALHHAAVAGERVDVEVEEREAVAVVAPTEPVPSDGHPDRVGDALAQRAGRGLDPTRPAVLGVPGTVRTELAEGLEVVERHRRAVQHLVVGIDRLDVREVQQRPQQGGGVALGEHETVPVGPDRVGRVEPQEALPERVRNRRNAHRRPRVTGIRLLHGVHAQPTDGVDGDGVRVLHGEGGAHGGPPWGGDGVVALEHRGGGDRGPARQ